MPLNGVAFVYGPPSVGKSFLMVRLGLAIASGKTVAGQKTNQCGVLYIAAEAGEGIKNRISMAKSRLGITDDAPFSLISAAPNLGGSDCDAQKLLDAIQQDENLHHIKYGVVIIDTLARVTAGYDENSSKDVGTFVKNAEFLAREMKALVIVVHHSGKNEDSGMRGSSALLGAADAVCKVSIRKDYTWFQIEKQRDGANNLGFSFKLKPVDVGKDFEGEIITTCVLDDISNLQQSDGTSRREKKSKSYIECMNSFQACIRLHRKEIITPEGANVNALDKEQFYSFYSLKSSGEKRDTIRKRLDRFLEKAEEYKEITSSVVDGMNILWRME